MQTKDIKNLMDDFDKSSLVKMKLEKDGFSLEFEKYIPTAVTTVEAQPIVTQAVAQTPVAVAAVATEEKPAVDANALSIKSPMVGTFYAAPSPTSPDFVKVGDTVKKGDTVAIVEAMKIMNEIEAEFDCKIVDILVKNGQVVEYEMPLFVVEKL